MLGSSPMGKLAYFLIRYSDKPYSTLKSGQHTMDREYYDKVTHEKPDGKRCLSNF